MRQQLVSEGATRSCYHHTDRPAAFVRIERRAKPVPQVARIPQCRECADRRVKKDEGLLEATLRPI